VRRENGKWRKGRSSMIEETKEAWKMEKRKKGGMEDRTKEIMKERV